MKCSEEKIKHKPLCTSVKSVVKLIQQKKAP
jgi:hypothetical protein